MHVITCELTSKLLLNNLADQWLDQICLQKCWRTLCSAGTILSVSFSAALAAALTVLAPGSAVADAALPYQQADQTAATQEAKTTPLSQDKQSAATNSSSQLPPLPTSFPLLPEVVVQAPQEVN